VKPVSLKITVTGWAVALTCYISRFFGPHCINMSVRTDACVFVSVMLYGFRHSSSDLENSEILTWTEE